MPTAEERSDEELMDLHRQGDTCAFVTDAARSEIQTFRVLERDDPM